MASEKKPKKPAKYNIADYVRSMYLLIRDGGTDSKNIQTKLSNQLLKFTSHLLQREVSDSGNRAEVVAETMANLKVAMIRQIENPPAAGAFSFEEVARKNEENDKRIISFVASVIRTGGRKTLLTQAGRYNQELTLAIQRDIRSLISSGKILQHKNLSCTLAPGLPPQKEPDKAVFSAKSRLNHSVVKQSILFCLQEMENSTSSLSQLTDAVRKHLNLMSYQEDSLNLMEENLNEGQGSKQPVSEDAADGIVINETEPLAQEIFLRVLKKLPQGNKGRDMLFCYVKYQLDPEGIRPGLEELAREIGVKSPQTILNYCEKFEAIMKAEVKKIEFNETEKKWLIVSLCKLMIGEAENNG